MKNLKKTLILFCSLLFTILSFTIPSIAEDNNQEPVEYTITVEIHEIPSLTRSSTKTGYKVYTCSGATRTAWTYTVYGKFSYNGTTATCINITDSYEIIDSTWKIATHSTRMSGNKAIGTATFNETFFNSVVRTIPITVTLSCSPDGTLY